MEEGGKISKWETRFGFEYNGKLWVTVPGYYAGDESKQDNDMVEEAIRKVADEHDLEPTDLEVINWERRDTGGII